MITIRVRALFSVCLCLMVQAGLAQPIPLIFDTDMGNDVDDALALAMLHSLQSRGESELLAVTITKDHQDVAPYVDALNTFYGRPDIPIGVTNSGVTPEESRFTGIIHERDGGNDRYPHDLRVGDPAPTAVSLLRQTLAGQPDNSVVIVQVGFSGNLSELLRTPGDQYSPLDGEALVMQKVRLLSIMAGAFAPVNGGTHLEYNIVQDIASAQYLAANWPTSTIWSGFEVGLAIRYPAVSIDEDFAYQPGHPIAESYQRYIPTPHERPTWDLTSVLWAVRPDRGYFSLSDPGSVDVLEGGETVFRNQVDGQHRFLIVDDSDQRMIVELMAALVSEPPH